MATVRGRALIFWDPKRPGKKLDAETVYGPLFRTGANLTTYSNPDVDGLGPEAPCSDHVVNTLLELN